MNGQKGCSDVNWHDFVTPSESIRSNTYRADRRRDPTPKHKRMKNTPPEVREKRFRNVGDPRRTDRFKSTYEHGAKSPFVVHGVAAYERAFKLLEDALARSGGPWILGSDPTLADINLMPHTARLDYLSLLDLWIKDRPRVKAW